MADVFEEAAAAAVDTCGRVGRYLGGVDGVDEEEPDAEVGAEEEGAAWGGSVALRTAGWAPGGRKACRVSG